MDCLNSIISPTPVDTICSVLGWQVFCAQARHGIDALPSSVSSRCRAVGTGGSGGHLIQKIPASQLILLQLKVDDTTNYIKSDTVAKKFHYFKSKVWVITFTLDQSEKPPGLLTNEIEAVRCRLSKAEFQPA